MRGSDAGGLLNLARRRSQENVRDIAPFIFQTASNVLKKHYRQTATHPVEGAGPLAGAVSTQHYVTLKGEHRALMLADGSRVTLDADSQLDVTLEARFRRLTLVHGRAYFQVAHDRSRPFPVTAGGREVVAAGREFDLSKDGGRVQAPAGAGHGGGAARGPGRCARLAATSGLQVMFVPQAVGGCAARHWSALSHQKRCWNICWAPQA